jgi:hypothetical protein
MTVKTKTKVLFAFGAVSVLSLTALRNQKPVHAEPPPAAVSKDEATKIATDAYVFGYPLVTMHLTRAVVTNVARPTGSKAPVNQLANLKEYPDASFRDVTAPNADTLYSSAFIDLSKEPVVFAHPDMGERYFLFPMLDAYTNVVEVPTKRTTGGKAATYLLTGPGWQGQVPEGAKQLKFPTNTVWLLGRTYCTGTKEDYAAVHALQAKYQLMPLSAWGKAYSAPAGNVDPKVDMKTAVRDQVDAMSATEYFSLLAKLMRDNPPAAADAPVVARMAKLGIVPGQPFDAAQLGAPVAAAVDAAPKAGLERLKGRLAEEQKKLINGWMVMTNTGDYGTDYVWRAVVTAVGLGANRSKDAVYPFSEATAAGEKYSGQNQYVMRFPKGQLPPAKAFWSLTMYDDKAFFVKNPINRYSISERNDLKRNPDGSVDITIQNEKPAGKNANWLPAPKGPFTLMLRLYWPNENKPSILDGSWKPPAVEIDKGTHAQR